MPKGDLEINYSKAAPTAEVGAAPAPTQIRSGAEAIARGMMALGQGFEAVATARRDTELSLRKAKYAQTTTQALQDYSQIGDPVERKKKQEDWDKQQKAIFTTTDPFLQPELQKMQNELLPHAGGAFAKMDLEIKERNDDDAFKAAYQHWLEQGNLSETTKLIDDRVKNNRLSPAEAEQMIKDAPNNSILIRAAQAIGNQKGEDALVLLNQAKDMNPAQEERWHTLKTAAQEVSTKATYAVQNQIKLDLFDNEDKPAEERLKIGEDAIAQLETLKAQITPARYSVLVNQIRKFQEGPKVKTESKPDALIEVGNAVNNLRKGSVTRSQTERVLSENSTELSGEDFKTIQSRLDSKLPPADNKIINDAIDAFEKNASKEKLKQSSKLRFALEDEIAKNPNASPEQKQTLVKQLSALYGTEPLEPQFTGISGEPSKILSLSPLYSIYNIWKTELAIGALRKPAKERPTNVPEDAQWDENRKMWTYTRDGRLKGIK